METRRDRSTYNNHADMRQAARHAPQPESHSAARQRAAIARHDARKAQEAARERVARLAVCCAAVAVAVALFYAF